MYYLVGSDELETHFRVIKIDRRVERPKNLEQILREDPIVYSKDDMAEMLAMIHDGNKHVGGIVKIATAYGLVGFVKFLDCFYFTLITQRKLVGSVGANEIYAVKATEIFPVKPPDGPDDTTLTKFWRKLNKKINQSSAELAESRYMVLFQLIDMSKDFFFSYTYDLTHSLQHNFIMSSKKSYPPPPTQEIFEWNYHQTGL